MRSDLWSYCVNVILCSGEEGVSRKAEMSLRSHPKKRWRGVMVSLGKQRERERLQSVNTGTLLIKPLFAQRRVFYCMMFDRHVVRGFREEVSFIADYEQDSNLVKDTKVLHTDINWMQQVHAHFEISLSFLKGIVHPKMKSLVII